LGLRVWDSGFRVWGVGLRVYILGFRVYGVCFWGHGAESRVLAGVCEPAGGTRVLRS